MKARARRRPTALHARPRPAVKLSRRRLVVLLAASAAAVTALVGCGEDERLQPGGGYKFPGAKKDETGNFRMRNI